jgi:hypothetical protein
MLAFLFKRLIKSLCLLFSLSAIWFEKYNMRPYLRHFNSNSILETLTRVDQLESLPLPLPIREPKTFLVKGKCGKAPNHSFLDVFSDLLALFLCQSLSLNSQKMFRLKLLLKKSARRSEKTSRKLWFGAFPHLPLTKKVLGSRMGKGKGKLSSWSTRVKVSSILFELKCLRYGRILYFSNQIALRLNSKHKLLISRLNKNANIPVLYRNYSLVTFSNF